MYNLKLYLHVNVPNPSVIVLCCQHMRKLREQLNKLQYHFRVTVSGRGEIHTWISDLNPSSFDFTKKKKENTDMIQIEINGTLAKIILCSQVIRGFR